jgi:hypothetical protein
MDYIEKRKRDNKKGKESEELFERLMNKEGHVCLHSTKSQNKQEHWDFCVVTEGIFDKIDVKSMKEATADGRTWFELQNNSGGIGWGKCEFLNTIAFEQEDCFDFVNRVELLKIVEKKVEEEDQRVGEKDIYYVLKESLKDYQRYRRLFWGHDDRVVKVPFADFQHLIYKKLYK